MNQRLRLTILAATLSLGAASGCDDSSSSSSSGVSGSKTVDEITDADAKKVCEWMNDQFSADDITTKQLCTEEIVADASSKSECTAAVKACEEEVSADPDTSSDEDDGDCSMAAAQDDLSPGCSKVTVADFEACVKALKKAATDYYAGLSCDDAGSEPKEPSLPAVCKTIATNCPEIAPDGLDG